MYVSCSSLLLPTDDYPEIHGIVEKIGELGFEAMDLATFDGWMHVAPSVLASDAGGWAGRFSEAVSGHGMRVSSFNGSLSCSPGEDKDDAHGIARNECRALIDMAVLVSCPNVTISAGGKPEKNRFAKEFDLAENEFAKLASLTAETNVSLSSETHVGTLIEDPEAALRFARDLWPGVGLTYDASHFVMRDIPLAKTECLFEYTRHVHVRSASPGKMQNTLADGSIDFKWLLDALRANEYNGALTVEYFGSFDEHFSETLALKKLLERLLEN
jgi:sugar phosphate isomerase/epimerase